MTWGSEWALELGGMRWGVGSCEWASREVGEFKILGPILSPKKNLMNPSRPPILTPFRTLFIPYFLDSTLVLAKV